MSRGDNIKALQALLNSTLQPPPQLDLDGRMGPKTRAALARYHSAKQSIGGGNVGGLIKANPAPAPDLLAHSPESDTWMTIAEGELGVSEVKGTSHNKRIIEYHATTTYLAKSDEVAWCSSFVNWVMKGAGYIPTRSAAAKSWLNWGVSTEPRHGAITVVKLKGSTGDPSNGSPSGFHVAFLVGSSATHIKLLGGNQGNMVKISPHRRSSYEIWYRWPA